jgi:hypothetical protein
VKETKPFCYRAGCSVVGCTAPAAYKVAASWSDGTSRELKNYGLACEVHRDFQLARARAHHGALRLSEGETVGPVEAYVLRPNCRDAELARLTS